ncbi:hypothetical protein C0Z17_12675 [Trinickia caryophylli]|nr:hypothetical protein C0Z17_12675 [Trinickia caryophylli]
MSVSLDVKTSMIAHREKCALRRINRSRIFARRISVFLTFVMALHVSIWPRGAGRPAPLRLRAAPF